MTRPTCETCVWSTGRWMSRCHRFPPQRTPFIVFGTSVWAFSEFPLVDNTDWCGEHQEKTS